MNEVYENWLKQHQEEERKRWEEGEMMIREHREKMKKETEESLEKWKKESGSTKRFCGDCKIERKEFFLNKFEDSKFLCDPCLLKRNNKWLS